MKKRIIASTMASVMALSGAASALVAAADVADFNTQAVSKADLKKFMEDKEITALVDGGIDNYGSISGENFQKAVDFANAVLDDADATADDATAAYLMVKAAKAALKQYTKEELQLLVAECKPKYETNNELNEDDAIYDEDDWTEFVEAYETADDCKESDDILETTDAYEELDAKKNPKELTKKTKREIDTARNNYIKALNKEFEFQPWQRGTVSGTKTDYDGLQFAWGTLYAHIASAKDDLMDTYDDFTKFKGRSVTTNTEIVEAVNAMENAAKVLNGFESKFESASTKASVTGLLSKYHGQLVYTYNKTDAAKLITDLQAAAGTAGADLRYTVDGVVTENADAPTTANLDEFWNLENSSKKKYQPLGGNGKVGGTGADNTANVTKLIGAALEIESSEKLYYVLDKKNKLENGKYAIVDTSVVGTGTGNGYFFDDKGDASDWISSQAAGTSYEVKTLNAKSTLKISDYLEVTPQDILDVLASSASGASAVTDAVDALQSAIDGLYKAGTPATGDLATDKTAVGNYLTSLQAVTGATAANTQTVAAISAAIDDAKALVSAIDTAIAAVNDSTIDDDDIADVVAAATNMSSLLTAIGTATTTESVTLTGLPASAPTIQTSALAAGSTLEDLRDDIDDAKDALSDELETITMSSLNMVMDLDSEMAFKLNSDNKTDKGLKYFHDGALLSSFQFAPYASSRDTWACDLTVVSLAKALMLYQEFVADPMDLRGAHDLDNMLTISPDLKADKNDPKSWRLLYNYMKYALEDEFEAAAVAEYKLKDVIALTEKSEKLLTDTVETALFTGSHNNLVTNVNAANEWIKLAKADKSRYEDCQTTYSVNTVEASGTTVDSSFKDSTAMYNELNDTYKQLKKEYDGFKYSYGDIVKTMSDIAKQIDKGDFSEDVAKKLAKDLEETAAAFIKITDVFNADGDPLDDCGLFNDDGTMNTSNRLYTYGDKLDSLYFDGTKIKIAESKKADKENYEHFVMQKAYEKLVQDYTDATTKPEDKVTTDVDGNGKFELADVSAMLKIYVDKKGEVSKHDFNKDGKVDLTDVTELLKQYVNKK